MMNLDYLQLAGIGVIICAGGILQSTVGFAYGLFATPLILWLGVPLPLTISIVLTASFLQTVLGVRDLRDEIPWSAAFTAILSRLLFTLAGIVVLKQLTFLDSSQVNFIVGCILVLMLTVQLSVNTKPGTLSNPVWRWTAFSTSGFFAGLCGMGGPPLVLWSMTQNWSSKTTRGFLFAVFMVSIPVQLLLFYTMFGSDIGQAVLLGFLFLPAALLGGYFGLPIGNRLDKPLLRKIAYVVLFAIALNLMLGPLVQWSS
jgi:uncharacterized membrane protein YfcA